jgi:hypothetical protein
MKIGRRRRDIAQARHAHRLRLPLDQRTKNALPFEQIAADIDALMTGTATERLEQAIAFEFIGRQRRGIAAKPAVEPAPRGQQRPLEGHKRVEKAVALGRTSISGAEIPDEVRIGVQLPDDLVDAGVQIDGIFERGFHLHVQRTEIALPIQPVIERGVEDRQRVEKGRTAMHCAAAGTVGADVVAG